MARKQREYLDYEQLSLSGFRIERGFYTTGDVAQLYRVSITTIHNWIKNGWIDATRNDSPKGHGMWHIHPSQLEDIDSACRDLYSRNKGLFVPLYGKQRKLKP